MSPTHSSRSLRAPPTLSGTLVCLLWTSRMRTARLTRDRFSARSPAVVAHRSLRSPVVPTLGTRMLRAVLGMNPGESGIMLVAGLPPESMLLVRCLFG